MSEPIIWIPILSLWQPWANAIVVPHPQYPERGIKEFETRSWTTKVRGRILVHAAKKKITNIPLHESLAKYKTALQAAHGNIPYGFIVGSVEIRQIITSEEFQKEGPGFSGTPVDEFYWGNWEPKRFGWKLAKPVVFASPIPCVGRQGFWKFPLQSLPEQYQKHFK